MKLNSVIEQFYLSVLDYSGLELSDNIIVNKNEKLGEFTVNGKEITLPYLENLKNPDNKIIFHPLNENYVKPETNLFNLYKKKLVHEINVKILSLFVTIINIANSVELQSKIKNTKLVELITGIGETDLALIEHLINLSKHSQKVNDEAFMVDIFLKKNGEVKDIPYAAIGKINFILYNEVNKALEEKEREYKVFGYKLRKKDLLAINNLFNVVFPNINTEEYMEGTDNKIFRFMNILLKTSYLLTNRINEIVKYLETLKDETLNLKEVKFNHEWVDNLEDLYKMSNEIRLIPNQTDISNESPEVKRLHVDESASKNISTDNIPMTSARINEPINQIVNQPTYTATAPVNATPTPEEILRNMNRPYVPQYPVMQPSMMQQPNFVPAWMAREANPNMTNNPNMQPGMMMNPGMMNPNMMMQPNMMNPNMMMQPNMQPNMQPGMMMNPGMMNPNMQPGMMMNPGMMNPNMQPGMMMNPNMMNPNMQPGMMMNPGMMNPNMQPNNGLEINPLFTNGNNLTYR
ncbi:MAG: hypothetical protein ACD_33C00002G0041 [uncultured bacterium]|nr:MAG: hypothetical protein ACD_33C00002G0041 [uncultured bacterium]